MQAANLYPTDPRTGASVLYKNETVEVTPTILTILGTASTRMTYAVRNITSIGIKREEPNVIFPVLLILAGLFIVIAALQMTNVASALALIGVGLGVAALGVWLMRQSKADYYLVITMSSGEKPIVNSPSKIAIEDIESCVQRAMSAALP